MLKPVYALVGSDTFMQLQKQSELLQHAPKDVQRIDIDGERAQLSDVLDEIRSFAMFGGYKVVVVRDAEEFISKFREPLEKFLAAPVDSGTLLLRCGTLPKNTRIYKLIDKLGGIQHCEPPIQLASWIIAQAKNAHGLTLTPAVARLLAELVGGDLGRLDNELAKLAISTTSARIGPDDISGTIAFQKELEMVELTNALTVGNAPEAIRRWRQLVTLDSGSQFSVFVWIANWLMGMQKGIRLKQRGAGNYEVYQEARIWKDELKEPFMRTMIAMGSGGIEKALAQLAEVEYQSKTGIGNASENIERFILSLPLKA